MRTACAVLAILLSATTASAQRQDTSRVPTGVRLRVTYQQMTRPVLAVHRAADDIIKWATGQPGMAASRIVFRRHAGSGDELVIVDSDGQNLHRFIGSDMLIYSPTWSPDGSHIAYTQQTGRGWQLIERDVH